MKARSVQLVVASALAGGLVAIAGSASAHHSYAMFDRTRSIAINGAIYRFDWTNPHVYIWVYVLNDKGGKDLWAIEGGPPSRLNYIGWDRHSFNPGDSVKMIINPLRDGRTGGYFVSATRPDGKELFDHLDR